MRITRHVLCGITVLFLVMAQTESSVSQSTTTTKTTKSRTETVVPTRTVYVQRPSVYYYERYYINGCPCIRRVRPVVATTVPAKTVAEETTTTTITTFTEVKVAPPEKPAKTQPPQVAAKPKEPESKPAPVMPTTTHSAKIVVLGEHPDLIRLLIETEGIEESEKKAGASIRQRIAGAIENNVAAVFTRGDADLRLVVTPTLNTIDQAGEYFKINCNVELELKDADGNRVFGTHDVNVVGARTLGEDAAVAKLVSPAAKESAKWCNEKLKEIAEKELDVTVLEIQLGPRQEKPSITEENNEKIKSLSDKIAKLNGLVRHDYLGYDSGKNSCEFRVLYFRNSHPAGIANTVGALLDQSTQIK